MTKITATPTEQAAAALVEKIRRENEDLMRKITEIFEEQYTGFADFLHECKVQGLSLDEAAELFDSCLRRGLLPLKKEMKE